MRPEDFLGGPAAFAPLVVDSSISKASPLLFESAASGTIYPTVSLTACATRWRHVDRLRAVDA